MYMRKACLKALALALAVTAWATSTNQAQAQLETTLINFNSSWKYNNTGTDLGTAWRAISYPSESTWTTGQGILGVEDVTGINAYQAIAPFNTQFSGYSQSTITYYFRTTFNFSGSPTAPGLQLFATNLVDDGCVIYLNGSVAGSIRMPTSYTYTTLASGGPAAEGQRDVVTISPSLLRSGVNTIAVEVHQSSTTSSDVAFGMRLVAITPQALVITNQPQSQTIAVGESVTFTVGDSGGPVNYRWQKDGANLSAITPTLTIANAQPSAAGDYRVIVTNAVGAVTSSVARLTVVQDSMGPELVSAIIDNGFGSNFVNVRFSEALSSSVTGFGARNPANYRLVSLTSPNTSYPITNVLYSTALGALLAVGTPDWNPNGSYYLVANNISDTRGNNINPNSVIGVSRLIRTNLTQMSDIWNFYDCGDIEFCDPNSDAVYANEAWAKTNFVADPFYWGIGAGIFVKESGLGEIEPCAGDVRGTIPGFQMDPTLFRRTFRMPADASSNGTIKVRFIVDDGMVVYLNGRPILTNNAPYPITRASRALASIGNATCNTNNNFNLVVNNLRPGTNWLAAAVLQNASAPESDTVFGLELDLITEVFSQAPTNRAPGTPTLTRTRQGNRFVLSWPATNYGYALMYSTEITGSGANPSRNWYTNEANWTQVNDQSNPYTNNLPPSTGPRRFYKLYREKLN